MQVLISMIDLGLDPQQALEAPRRTSSQAGQGANWPHDGNGTLSMEEGRPHITTPQVNLATQDQGRHNSKNDAWRTCAKRHNINQREPEPLLRKCTSRPNYPDERSTDRAEAFGQMNWKPDVEFPF